VTDRRTDRIVILRVSVNVRANLCWTESHPFGGGASFSVHALRAETYLMNSMID